MLIKCPECGEQISDQVEACPKCGIPNPAARAALSRQQQKGLRRRRLLRSVAIALALLILAAGGTALYFWRFSVQHDIVRCVVGPVTGTTGITQQRFANVVESVAEEWNRAAGKTVLWSLPFGRRFDVSLNTDKGPAEDYVTKLARLQKQASEADAASEAASNAEAAYRSLHPSVYDTAGNLNKASPFWPTYQRLLRKWLDSITQWDGLLDESQATREKNSLKDTHILGERSVSGAPGTSVFITAYVDDADLRALLLHAFGHRLGLAHSSGDDVMSGTGRSTTITKELAAEVAAGH